MEPFIPVGVVIPQSSTNKLLAAWKSFVEAIKSSTDADIEEFRNVVDSRAYSAMYPVRKRPYTVSFKHMTASENIEGIWNLITKNTTQEGSKMSERRRKYLGKLLKYIEENAVEIRSPKDFERVAQAMMPNPVAIIDVVSRHANTGEIEWNTKTGQSFEDWKSYGTWQSGAPSQKIRRQHFWENIVELSTKAPTSVPRVDSLPIYGLSFDRKTWIKYGVSSKKSANTKIDVDVEREFPTEMRRSMAWKTVLDEAAPGADPRERNGLYILVVRDDEAPAMYAWQAYAGKAEPSVLTRWLGRESSTHMSGIVTVIENAASVPPRMPKATTLIDFFLALAWVRHGTWSGIAWLFVVASGIVSDGEVVRREAALISLHSLTDPRFGLNMVL